MIQWKKVFVSGILATVVMELFYRITDILFQHGINVPYANGAAVGLTSPVPVYLAGYAIDFFGGVAFALIYSRFVRPKTYGTGILYAVFFVWLIVGGLIFEPVGSAGILMLNNGLKAVAINLLAHVVYGSVLGFIFSWKRGE